LLIRQPARQGRSLARAPGAQLKFAPNHLAKPLQRRLFTPRQTGAPPIFALRTTILIRNSRQVTGVVAAPAGIDAGHTGAISKTVHAPAAPVSIASTDTAETINPNHNHRPFGASGRLSCPFRKSDCFSRLAFHSIAIATRKATRPGIKWRTAKRGDFIAARRRVARKAHARRDWGCHDYELRRRFGAAGGIRSSAGLSTSASRSRAFESVDEVAPGIEYRSSAQAPRSMSLQRSLQKGRDGLSVLYSAMVPQCGQRTRFRIMTRDCSR